MLSGGVQGRVMPEEPVAMAPDEPDEPGRLVGPADYQRRAHAAVRVAAALHRPPVGPGPLDQIRGIGEGGRSGEREPVPQRLEHTGLSCARCDSVYRWRWRVSSSMSSSRPVNETG